MEGAVALVMAGGKGRRMLASGVRIPKPLVPVAGVTLLEHNTRLLLRWGLNRIVVSVPGRKSTVDAFCHERLAPLVHAAGGRLDVLVEAEPLGNIGCAARLADLGSDVVVVFADNLTVLDLRALLAFHRLQNAALTLACHEHEFRIPYGRLETTGTRVTGYLEKPAVPVLVASAVSVLAPRAMVVLADAGPAGLVDLTTRLIQRGEPVAAYRHQADWVDVNDAAGVAEAERLVTKHAQHFPTAATRDPR